MEPETLLAASAQSHTELGIIQILECSAGYKIHVLRVPGKKRWTCECSTAELEETMKQAAFFLKFNP